MLVQGLQGPLWLNSVNVVGMLVRFLLMSDVDHRISSETFVYRPNRHILFPLNVYSGREAGSVKDLPP